MTSLPDRSHMSFDALVLDGLARQALMTTRTLGRHGLQVATAECSDLCDSPFGVPTFASRWSLRTNTLPSYHDDPTGYARAVIDLASAHPTRVVIPSMDGSVAALRSWRSCFEQHGIALALASEAALDAANDKKHTLASAAELGIPAPRTIAIECVEETSAVLKEVGYPAVIKPTQSWVSNADQATRVVSRAVLNESEALDYVERLIVLGGAPVVQQMVNGPREAVSVFYAKGKVWAKFAQVAYRTTPVLGGVSVVRESIPMPVDLEAAALALVRNLDLEGCCEVEFRRDSAGRPLLMEINARLSGSIEVAIRSGVPFPTLLWQWAAGEPLTAVPGYRPGIKMRYLKGDMKWLWENIESRGRQPDGVTPQAALATFAKDFVHRQSYDYMDRHDLGPAVAALAGNVRLARRKLTSVARRPAVLARTQP
jgi:predicted ATP-grasp superfamily ATP-dependent carboligase